MLSEKDEIFLQGGIEGNLTKRLVENPNYINIVKRGVLKVFAAKSCLKGESF